MSDDQLELIHDKSKLNIFIWRTGQVVMLNSC